MIVKRGSIIANGAASTCRFISRKDLQKQYECVSRHDWDSYENALAKTEVILHCGSWRSLGSVEFATLEGVGRFINRWLLQPIGNIPPAELEVTYSRHTEESAEAA